MSVAESNVVLVEAFDAVVGEYDAIDVARQIEQGLLTGTNLLHVHGRSLFPDGRIDLLMQAGAGKRSTQLCAKDAREHVAGSEEARMSRLEPRPSHRGTGHPQ